jgi:hypothetical protein
MIDSEETEEGCGCVVSSFLGFLCSMGVMLMSFWCWIGWVLLALIRLV